MSPAQKLAIPPGNTLLCLPLNCEWPIKPDIFECTSVDDAFLHVKPSCILAFTGYGEDRVREMFFFNSIADFSVGKICHRSIFLTDLVNDTIGYFENANVITPLEFGERVHFILEYAELTEESELTPALRLLKANLISAVRTISPIEKSYLELSLFFSNRVAEGKTFVLDSVDHQLFDLDNSRFIDAIQDFITWKSDRLDMRNAISCLVIPAFFYSYMALEKFAKICGSYGVMLFTDLSHFDNTAAPTNPLHLSSCNSGNKYLDFSDSCFAHICFTQDQLFINSTYSFLDTVAAAVSFSTAVAALVPTFILSNPVKIIDIKNINSRVRIIKNTGGYKSYFNSISVEKNTDFYVIVGNKTLYQGNRFVLKSISLYFFCNWLLKKFTQLMNLTLIDQIDISPPGSLHNLRDIFKAKICSDFYFRCKAGGEIPDTNLDWLVVIPDWLNVVCKNHEISYLWPVSFTLIIKFRVRKTDDSLSLMHIRLPAESDWNNQISGFFDVAYEDITEDDLVNFTREIQ